MSKQMNIVELTEIPVEWRIPVDMHAPLATHVLVAHTDHGEFILTFLEGTLPPPGDGQSSPAQAIARIGMVASRIPGVINALQSSYDHWLTMQGSGDANPVDK